jgi:hypothetical protein
MRMKFLIWLIVLAAARFSFGDSISISLDDHAAPRVVYGADRLRSALEGAGIRDASVVVGRADSERVRKIVDAGELKPEGFLLKSVPDGSLAIVGADDSGELYGCLELARRVKEAGKLPLDLNFADAPAFRLRGPCIGMQKTYILPGRKVYEYPYTPELFPFFYDKGFWREYLDYLADNRMNTLYIWSGHPFASLVELPDYPYAVEVSPEVLAKNEEMYRYVVTEADKRGIWVVQMFYNILVSKPFAEHNGISTQLSAPTPLVADYTRKSIAKFVEEYPNVGLMFCLGEALRGLDNQKYWCTQVILPGVKDGMAAAHLTREPPVIIRTHATDLTVIMPEALKVYTNLYTEEKFNGESLTTWEPRGKRQELHLTMSRLGSTHIINVHILANLEPFRYGDQEFIRKCMLAARDRLGAKGMHLYPLSYWNWPDAPDDVNPPLKQLDRDWIWFEAWARYAWNPDVDEATDHAYWVGRIADHYGSAGAEKILAAYDDSGECAPRLLRRFGITEGNRQTLSLGMTLDELVDPQEYGAFSELWESQSPPGERLGEYVDKEWNHQSHEGETPPEIIQEALDYSGKAVAEIDAAGPLVTANKEEYGRLRNDIYCIQAMSEFYGEKVRAAMDVLRYRHSHDLADLDDGEKHLLASLNDFETLAKLGAAYRFANSMQTSQRQIPVPGGAGGKPANYLWAQVLPVYRAEYDDFHRRLAALHEGTTEPSDEGNIQALPGANFKLLTAGAQSYEVKVGAKVYSDRDYAIQSVAPELNGLTGIMIVHSKAKKGKYVPVEIETTEPVRVLIGYFRSTDKSWLQVPDAETDAAAAERGETEALFRNAVSIPTLPSVDVYAESFDAGRHKIEISGAGSFIILGVIPQSVVVHPRDAHQGDSF